MAVYKIPTEHRTNAMIKTLDMMPPISRKMLLHLCKFLQTIIENAEYTKMTPGNKISSNFQ